MFGNPDLRIEPKDLPPDVYYPAIREFVHKDLLAKAEKDIKEAETSLAEAKKELAEIKDKLAEANWSEPRLLADGNRAVEAAGAEEVSATDKELLDGLRHAEDKVALAEKARCGRACRFAGVGSAHCGGQGEVRHPLGCGC